jgi:acetolactate synthase-1/3 small subunit
MTITTQAKRRAILIFILNRSGALNKISMLIRRKMYNVETLTACTTSTPDISRMTLTLREDSDQNMRQVVKQIEKMTEVISAKELDINQSFWREVAIVKFQADDTQFKRLKDTYSFDILDRQAIEVSVVQIAGTSQMIDAFLQAVGERRVIELARSGFTALEK